MPQFELSPDSPVLQPAYVRLLCDVLRKKGVDLGQTLQHAGLGDLISLQSRERAVSVQQVAALVATARAAGFDDRLALDVGALFQVSAHGPLGYAVVASPNLQVALQTIGRFAHVRYAALQFVFRSGPRHGTLDVVERVDLDTTRVFVLTSIALTIAHVAAAAHAGDSALKQVSLPFKAPVWAKPLEAALKCPCQFEARALRFEWDARDLLLPNATADAQAFGDAIRSCEHLLSALAATTLTARVKDYLSANEKNWPGLIDVAAQCHISPRTLIRRLKEEGTSFQHLRDALRSQRAEWYLTQTGLSIEDIAHRLGYKDASNFSRSFQRWFQATPAQLRQTFRARTAL
jgi:AraC-like DNA-binding protein